MLVFLQETSVPTMDCSRSVLDFIHQHLGTSPGKGIGLDSLVRGLAEAFTANGAGLALVEAGGAVTHGRVAAKDDPSPLPWEEDATLLAKIQPGEPAIPLGSFLVAGWCHEGLLGGLVWVESDTARSWTTPEAFALALAGQVLSNGMTKAAGARTRWAQQLDRAARQRNLELVGQVSRRLAHDFGNVLTGILGFNELALAQHIPANTPLHTYINEAHKAAQNGALFTHQLRLLSRRQSATTGLNTVSGFLADEEKRLRSLWGPGLSLSSNFANNLPAVSVDADQLRQALNAILENARDAVQGIMDGSVQIVANTSTLTEEDCRDFYGDVRPGKHLVIEVSDNGKGLSAEAAQRVFSDPFFSTKTRKRGFGLALAFSVLSSNRGGLDLQPGAQRGTVVRLVVPLAPELKAPKVLVVDDDPLILQFVCTALEQAGYQVQKASSASDAFHSYKRAAVDLVLSDVAMPRETGIDLARRLIGQDANVRLLFMSGKAVLELEDPDLISRQFGLLAKPFRTDGLLTAVRTALGQPTTADSFTVPIKA